MTEDYESHLDLVCMTMISSNSGCCAPGTLQKSESSSAFCNVETFLPFLKVWENHLADHLSHSQYSSASATILEMLVCEKCDFPQCMHLASIKTV